MSWADVSWTDVSWADVSWSDVSWADVSWADVLAVADVSWEDAAGNETEPAGGDYLMTADVDDELASDPELNPDAEVEPTERGRCGRTRPPAATELWSQARRGRALRPAASGATALTMTRRAGLRGRPVSPFRGILNGVPRTGDESPRAPTYRSS